MNHADGEIVITIIMMIIIVIRIISSPDYLLTLVPTLTFTFMFQTSFTFTFLTWLSAHTCPYSPSWRTRPLETVGWCPGEFELTQPIVIVIKMIVMMVCVSENSLSWGCESWWQRWRCPSNLSIRREHGLEVALLHWVGQIRNVEVRRVLLRLSGHLSLGQNWLYKRKNIKRTIFKYLPVCPDPVTRAQQLTLTWETQSRQSHIPASHIIILSYPCRYAYYHTILSCD